MQIDLVRPAADSAAAALRAIMDDWLARVAGTRPAVVTIGWRVPPLAAPDSGAGWPVICPVATACNCCGGDLVLRVTLVRLLRRHRPDRLLVLQAPVHRDADPDFPATTLRQFGEVLTQAAGGDSNVNGILNH